MMLKGNRSLVETRPPTVEDMRSMSSITWRCARQGRAWTGCFRLVGRCDITDFEEVMAGILSSGILYWILSFWSRPWWLCWGEKGRCKIFFKTVIIPVKDVFINTLFQIFVSFKWVLINVFCFHRIVKTFHWSIIIWISSLLKFLIMSFSAQKAMNSLNV